MPSNPPRRRPLRRCVTGARKSRFVDIFRTTPVNTVCPNFFVLAHANGCAFAPHCSYCFLKSSFTNSREQKAFDNIDKMVRDIRTWIARDRLESYVLNMGNLSDSLAFERGRPLIATLVDLFRREAEAPGRPHALLLVTKGGMEESRSLLALEPCANVIVSFSINSPAAAADHEKGAAPIPDRLAACRALRKAGWRVRVRIDPMIHGYDYRSIIRDVKRLKPERVTLGALRAEPNLFRFVRDDIFSALERSPNARGLSRYPLDVRLALYRPAVKALRPVSPIGLCEETPDVWNALGLDTEAKSCNCGG
jgi:DNA repair photolyase